MHELPKSSIDPALGWLQHTVRPLLCAAGSVGAAHAGYAGRDAGSDCPAARKPYTGGCFGGAEGFGCSLSRAEQTVLARVKGEPMSWSA